MKNTRKTKIVCTLGPASRSEERLAELIHAGVNVFRLNFSHGNHEEHQETLDRIRKVSKEIAMPVAILQDLSGPKIRITELEENCEVSLKISDTLELFPSKGEKSNNKKIYVETINPIQVVKPGEKVLLADGIITLEAIENNGNSVKCKVISGSNIRSRIGIAFPDSAVDLPATTEKDLVDFAWGIKNKVDFVAVSFVKHGKDIARVKQIAAENKADIKFIAKIEMKHALNNLDSIYSESHGIMVARGDLGVELPVEKVPSVQRELIERANFNGIPVIVATQMLHSMVKSMRPTRAEVSDIATAVASGADAVMLSEETSIGEYPVESVKVLSKIAQEAEKSFNFEEYKVRLKDSDKSTISDAIAYAACAAANKVNASAIVACTETGYSGRMVAKYRPQKPLYGVSSNEATIRRMCLYWGVIPTFSAKQSNHNDEIRAALKTVQLIEDLPNGSLAATTGGRSVNTAGATSILEISEMNFK